MTDWTGRAALELLATRPAEVGRLCGFDRLQDGLHGEWLRLMLFSREDVTLLAHRGSYKTTCLSLAMATLMLLEPRKKLLFLRKTDHDVTEVLRQVKRLLTGEVFSALGACLYGAAPQPTLSNAAEMTLSCHLSPGGAVQLRGQGIGGSLTGKHADIIFTDDIVNLTDRLSPPEREQTRAVYQELQNIRNPGGRLVNTGTPWHPEDAIALMPNVRRWDCYATGLLSPARLERLRADMSPSLFAANYELRHVAAEDALLPSPPAFAEGDALPAEGTAHLDASYGGGDSTALTCAALGADGRLWVWGRLWHGHVDRHLEEISAACARFRCAPLLVEVNGDRGYLARDLRSRGLAVHPYTERMNKYLKISTYLRAWWPRMVFLRDTDPAYLRQLQDYSVHAAHDDAPDSAASLIRWLSRRCPSLPTERSNP